MRRCCAQICTRGVHSTHQHAALLPALFKLRGAKFAEPDIPPIQSTLAGPVQPQGVSFGSYAMQQFGSLLIFTSACSVRNLTL